ncbi:MAG: fused MFS/spermidine synthase, partial [Myxococcales bacterium]
LGVGLYGMLTPLLFAGLGALYARVGPLLPQGGEAGGALLTAARFVLATLLILPPTFFMGCTFPLLTRRFASDPALGRRIGQLYTVNTLGAAAGTLFSTYVLLQAFGIRGTLVFTALLNAAIFGWAVWWQRREGPSLPEHGGAERGPEDAPRPRVRAWPVYLLAAFSGFLTLSFENVWSHVLALLVGTSSYAFGVVLFCFLLGLTVGGALVTRLLAQASPERVFGAVIGLLLATAAAIALTHGWWERVPQVFAVVGWFGPGFWTAELTRGAVAFGLIALPIVLMGMLFPAALVLLREFGASAARQVGVAYVFNTVGTIAGSVLTGFVLLGALGSEETLRLLNILPVAVALALLWFVRSRVRRALFATLALALAWHAIVSTRWDIAKMSDGSHIYFQPGYDI